MIARNVRLNLSILSVRKVSDSSSRISLYTLNRFSAIGTRRPSIQNIERWASGDKSCWVQIQNELRPIHLPIPAGQKQRGEAIYSGLKPI